MAVGIDAAYNAHLAIADALAQVWTLLSPTAQRSVEAELDQWANEDYVHTTAAQHLEYLQQVLAGKLSAKARQPLLAASLSPDRLISMYDVASALVFALYGMKPSAGISLNIQTTRDAIYQGLMPICACGAVADYGRDPYSDQLAVSLTLHPSRLGPPTLASIPYLLCHELVAHVFQGADHDSEDPFAEGWMDRVALQLHQAWAATLYPRAPEFARSHANQLSNLMRLNLSGLGRGQPLMRAAREQGWEAAGMVNEILSPYDKGPGPPTLFDQLSIELNVIRCDVGQRLSFVSAVYTTMFDDYVHVKYLLGRRLGDWVAGRCDAEAVLHFAD